MGGWGENRRSNALDGVGTTGQVEEAHKMLDALYVRYGPLAQRIVWFVEMTKEREEKKVYKHEIPIVHGFDLSQAAGRLLIGDNVKSMFEKGQRFELVPGVRLKSDGSYELRELSLLPSLQSKE